MFRYAARISCCLVFGLVSTFALAQAEFSADIVDLQKTGAPTQARIYFAKDKLRVESLDSGPRGGGAVIMNLSNQTAIILMPQQHMYMDMPVQSAAQRQSFTMSLFRAGDVENACADWQKAPHNQGGTCRKVGSETVNGRATIKYEGTGSNGDTGYFWLDPKLRFPIKWERKTSKGELQNIQEGTQPSSLFEVPAGFTKMQLPGGMQMPQH